MTDAEINWESWALAMCCLLDAIELHADDEDSVRQLVRGRFALAEHHGLQVEMLGPPATATVQ